MTSSTVGYIVLHAAAAAAFGFVLQRYVMNTSVETGVLWAGLFGTAAAVLAWHQKNR